MKRRQEEKLLSELGPEARVRPQSCGPAALASAPLALPDGGSRTAYGTGAVRESETGKGRYDLLPMEALRRLAVHYERGAVKYADENWRKGMPFRRCMASALRHLCAFLHGRRDEDHLAAVLWNVAAVMEFEAMIAGGLLDPELDDLPDWTGGPEGF